MKKETDIQGLLSGFFAGTLSDDERQRLSRYMARGRYASEVSAWLQQQWENIPQPPAESVRSDKMYASIMERINQPDGNAKPHPLRWTLRTVVRQTLRYAAVFALAFGLSWVVLREELAAPVAYNEIMVPYGSKTVVVLSDSSKVWLNAGARFKYPTRFDGDRREVFLQGEGFFDVAKDALRPFFVSAGGLNIKVLGTKFNVMANADDSRIEATLVEGSIEVLGMQAFGQGKPLTLQPGQTITLQKEADAYHVSKITGDEALPIPEEAAEEVKIRSASLSEKRDVNRTVAWKENKLIFADERFADAKVRLERWYGVVIEVEDPEILEYRFTGTFEKQTVEQAMAAFGKAALCHFRIENSRVVVSKLIIND